jgi:hypothetical protein
VQRELSIGPVSRVVVTGASRFGVKHRLEIEGCLQLIESRNTTVVAKRILLSAEQRRARQKGGHSLKGHAAI